MRIYVAAIIYVILAAVSPLRAQDRIETSETDFFVQTAGGNPAICGLDFTL